MRWVWKSMLFSKVTMVILLVLPILFLSLALPLFKSTVEDLQVPIMLVDSSEQTMVEELVDELEETEPFSLQVVNNLDLDVLARGEVEAIFEVTDDLETRILDGDTDELFTWYRHENSFADGLFKEHLASTLMEMIVKAESANLVMSQTDTFDWDEVFHYGQRYFEPDPIFQMDFQSFGEYGQEETHRQSEQSTAMYLLIIWTYCWLLMIYFTNYIYHWRGQQLFDRLSLYRYGRAKLYLYWIIVVLVIVFGFASVIGAILHSIDSQMVTWWQLMNELGPVLFISAVLILVSSLICRTRRGMLASTLSYLLGSVSVFWFISWGWLADNWFNYFFIPVWLL
ncbi:ABC transporter permease [Alkalibacillus aidingensis]|uniref:ABC transporter permease n=1 Tax=Alkalibacillus aidingensis TaxID=2747607 RepID=UPI0016603AE1|nr:ABC transporter permease [Alkalibacillus aidingensis]